MTTEIVSITVYTHDDGILDWQLGADVVGLSCNIAPNHIMVRRVWDDDTATEIMYNMANVFKVEVETAQTADPVAPVVNIADDIVTDVDFPA